MSSKQRRVVITGMSVISPLGNTLEALWQALTTGRSGVGRLGSTPPGGLPVSIAAEATDFRGEVEDFGPLDKEQKKAIRKGLKVMCRECQMGVAAAQLALADARLVPGQYDPERVGISFGSDYMVTLAEEFTEGIVQCLNGDGRFEFPRWPVQGMPKMSPLWLLKYLPNMPASHVAIYNDLRGPNNSLTLREAVANVALVEAFQIITQGKAEVMVVGATGTRIHPMKMIHAAQQEELAVVNGDPTKASRPFDRHRTGMVLGEGAGAIVVEELARAEGRGATIYGEVLGGASSAALGRNLLAHRDVAMRNALASALRNVGLGVDEIGHVQAHGLGTRASDADEARAICQVFRGRKSAVPVTAVKSYTGNLGAGSGMVELVAGVLALGHDCLFPLLNYEHPDPECPIAAVNAPGMRPGDNFVHLSVTPQGQASAAVIGHYRR